MSVSQSLQVFLQQRLSSLEQIEIMLLLRRSRERAWSASDVAAELRMPPEGAAMRLFLLASAGLLLFEPAGLPRYRYVGSDHEVEAMMSELETVYESNRPAVLQIVGAPPDPIRSFAEAFKLKKD